MQDNQIWCLGHLSFLFLGVYQYGKEEKSVACLTVLITLLCLQNFVSDLIDLNSEPTFETPERMRLLNEVVCEHFLRQGMLDIAEKLTQVSTVIRIFHM